MHIIKPADNHSRHYGPLFAKVSCILVCVFSVLVGSGIIPWLDFSWARLSAFVFAISITYVICRITAACSDSRSLDFRFFPDFVCMIPSKEARLLYNDSWYHLEQTTLLEYQEARNRFTQHLIGCRFFLQTFFYAFDSIARVILGDKKDQNQ